MEIFKISESLGFSTNKNLDKDLNFYLLQKYLREKHNIYVSVHFDSYSPDVPEYYAVVKSISSKNMGERLLDGFTLYSNYEDALEEGLFESLKLINK